MERNGLFKRIKEFKDLVSEIKTTDKREENTLFYKIKKEYLLISIEVSNAHNSSIINNREYKQINAMLESIYKECCYIKVTSYNGINPIPKVYYFPYSELSNQIVSNDINISDIPGKRITVTFPKAIFKITQYRYTEFKSPTIIDTNNRIEILVLPSVEKIDDYNLKEYSNLKLIKAPNLKEICGQAFKNIKSNKDFHHYDYTSRSMYFRMLRDHYIAEAKKEGKEINFFDIELKLAIPRLKAKIASYERLTSKRKIYSK